MSSANAPLVETVRFSAKKWLARTLDVLGINRVGIALQRLFPSSYIRVLYYHDVEPRQAAAFEAQLLLLRRYFEPASQHELRAFLQTGRWPHSKPGIVLTFDDGLRSNYEVAAPLLEKHGFQGWFFVPIGLVTLPPRQQPRSADGQLVTHGNDVSRDPRVFMRAQELRDLAHRHIIGCHTSSHVRLSEALPPATLDFEILDAKRMLEETMGKPVDSFAWVGGEEWAYSSGAARRIEREFRFAFTTNSRAVRATTSALQIDRTHVEADYPAYLVRFQLSGIMDLRHAGKRKRVARRIANDTGVSRAIPA